MPELWGVEWLEVQERRIWGWVGIQRYLSKQDSGIDFFRNGRRSSSVTFRCSSGVDPTTWDRGASWNTRSRCPLVADASVGEIHVDDVRVNHQKNAFEYDTPDWSGSCECCAARLRCPRPARHSATRGTGHRWRGSSLGIDATPRGSTTEPRRRQGPIDAKTKAWAHQFQHGDPEYQTDEKWYAAAVLDDNPPAPADDPVAPAGDILADKGINIPGTTSSQAALDSPPAPPESEDQRRARWRASAECIPDMEGKYGLRGRGAAIQATCWAGRG